MTKTSASDGQRELATPASETFWQRQGPSRAMHALARAVPPLVAEAMVRVAVRVHTASKPMTYRAASDNLSHVLEDDAGEIELDRCLSRLFYNTSKDYYYLFRNLVHKDSLERIRPPVLMADDVRRRIDATVQTGRGLFLVGTHTSNFDLVGIGMTHYLPVPMQVLSIANPTSGYRYFNARRKTDMGFVTPITPATLRQAIVRLRGGGIVFTAADRPIPGGNQRVTFFGHTAYLPTGYIRIPLATDALVMPISYHFDGTAYSVLGGPVMELERTGNRAHDIAVNAQRVLAELEPFIRRAPDQWRVFTRVFAEEGAADIPRIVEA